MDYGVEDFRVGISVRARVDVGLPGFLEKVCLKGAEGFSRKIEGG